MDGDELAPVGEGRFDLNIGEHVRHALHDLITVEHKSPLDHEIRHGGETSHFAVSACSAEESDLKLSVTGKWGEWVEDAVAPPGIVSLRWLLCLAALAVLAVHLYLATRGSLS